MGITNSFAKFLLHLKKQGADFDNTLTLGRLRLYTQYQSLEKSAKGMGMPINFEATDGQAYSEKFFEILGTTHLDSMDYSDYEKATIIHDLNLPIPESMQQKYSVVVDSGTLEHVFNFPIAIKNCMETLKVGGTYIGITPANNMMGHGFYQFSPELFYRIFSEENGFKVLCMFIGILDTNGHVEKWYDVKDPVTVQTRVTLRNFKETFLFIAAEKKIQMPVLKSNPFQSDYVTTWQKAKGVNHTKIPFAKKAYKEHVPERAQHYIRKVKDYFFKPQKLKDGSIGIIDATHFTEIKL